MHTISTNNEATSANAQKEIYVVSYPSWYLGWHVRILYFHTECNFHDYVTREVFKYFLDTCKYWCSQVKGIEVIKSFIFSAKSTWVDLLLPHLLDLSRNNKINKGKIQWANINAYDGLKNWETHHNIRAEVFNYYSFDELFFPGLYLFLP